MHVAHGEGSAVAVEAAGAEGGEAALVRQFRQRVGLVHELRELAAAEELLDGRGDRADVDQILRAHLVQVLNGHALLDHALQAGQAHADLVLQKLAHGAHAAVAEVVDVVHIADAVEEAELVADGGNDVVHQHVLGHELIGGLLKRLTEGQSVLAHAVQKRDQRGHMHALGKAHVAFLVLGVEVGVVVGEEGLEVGEVVADDAHFAAIRLHHDLVDAGVLGALSRVAGDDLAGGDENFARVGVFHVLGHGHAGNAAGQRQLFVELVAAHVRQIVALGVEQQGVHQAGGRFHRRRLARAQLVVNFDERLILAALVAHLALVVDGGGVAGDGGRHALVVAKQAGDLLVGLDAQGAQKHRHRQFAGAVEARVDHAVGIGLILDPGAAVGDHLRRIEEGAGLVDGAGEVDAGRAHQLRNDDALRAVDDEGAMLGHQREIAHEDLAFLDLMGVPVGQAHSDFQGRGIGGVALLALFHGVLGLVVERVVGKFEDQALGVVRDGGNVGQHFPKPFLEEVAVGVLLHLDQVGYGQRLLNAGKAHARALAHLHRMNHPKITPHFLIWSADMRVNSLRIFHESVAMFCGRLTKLPVLRPIFAPKSPKRGALSILPQ